MICAFIKDKVMNLDDDNNELLFRWARWAVTVLILFVDLIALSAE